MHQTHSSQQSFILLEPLAVIAIIGWLGVRLPEVLLRIGNSEQNLARSQVDVLVCATLTLRIDVGRFPTH